MVQAMSTLALVHALLFTAFLPVYLNLPFNTPGDNYPAEMSQARGGGGPGVRWGPDIDGHWQLTTLRD